MKHLVYVVSFLLLNVACQSTSGSGSFSSLEGTKGTSSSVVTETDSADFFDPYPPGTQGGVAVVARGSVACGKSLEGEWFCWGPNWYGIHGANVPMNGDVSQTNRPTRPIAGLPGEPSELVVGTRHACALVDARAYCFGTMQSPPSYPVFAGNPFVSVPYPEPVEGTFTQLAAGRDFTCGLERNPSNYLSSGRVRCWGANDKGQLGVGDTVARPAWAPQIALGDTPGWLVSELHHVSSIVAGENHVCALRDAHDNRPAAFYCWGANDKGQLGLGYQSPYETRPQRIESLTQVDSTRALPQHRKISAYGNRTCALNFGYVYCWGDNSGGEFGLIGEGWNRVLTSPTRIERHEIDFGAFRDIAVGNRHQCAARNQNGMNANLVCWGANDFNQLGSDVTEPPRFEVPVVTPRVLEVDREPSQLALGDDFTCVVYSPQSNSTGNTVRCFGRNDAGQTGRGSSNLRTLYPAKVGFPLRPKVEVTDVAIGRNSTCAVTGTKELRCFGYNVQNVLGIPQKGGFLAAPTAKVQGLQFTQASTPGTFHMCAVTASQEVYCWGLSNWAQTGQEFPLLNPIEPRKVMGLPASVVQVINLNNASCALTQAGEAYCWGSNQFGLAGFEYYDNFFAGLPVKIAGRYRKLAGMGNTACGIRLPTTPDMWPFQIDCWGDNSLGESGRTDGPGPVHVPRPLQSWEQFTDIAGDESGFCGVSVNGRVWCWGHNPIGARTGVISDPQPTLLPHMVALQEKAVSVSVSSSLACAITDSNYVYCWGLAADMQDDKPLTGVLGPRLMTGLRRVSGPLELRASKVSTFGGSTCAVTLDKTLICWGNQTLGRLGNGVLSETSQRTPFQVPFPVLE